MYKEQGYLAFQFHKGTIKTSDGFLLNGDPSRFQFHKGTIKTPHRLQCTLRLQVSIP